MILRLWHARASHENADAYPKHFQTNLAVELNSVEGFLGAALFRQDRPDAVEFLVLTRWASMDAVRAFAGDDSGRAVVGPAAAAALLDYDDRVQHFQLLAEVGPEGTPEPA